MLAVFWVVTKNGSGALPPPAPITLKDEVQNLAAGGWKAFPFYTSGGELNIDLRVVHGNPIDVFLTTGDQLDPMKRGDWAAVTTIATFDATRTATYRRTGSLGVGDYQLVVRDTTHSEFCRPRHPTLPSR